MADDASFFEIIEDAKPIAEEQWKGVSGMPVFAGSEILGVVKHVPPNFDHKKLEAVPAWRLLQDEGFRKALGMDEQRERLESARKLLRRLLEAATRRPAILLARAGVVVRRHRNAASRSSNGCSSRRRRWNGLFELALSIQQKRRGENDQSRRTSRGRTLMLTILPAIHDAAVVADVRRRKG